MADNNIGTKTARFLLYLIPTGKSGDTHSYLVKVPFSLIHDVVAG